MLLRKHLGGWVILLFSALTSGVVIVDAEDDPRLPTGIPPEPAVNPANIHSTSLPDSISRFHDPRTFKQLTHYTLSYSQDAITTSSGKTLYGIPIHPSDLRGLLQHADQFGRTQGLNAFSSSFKTSANGLTLIMNAIASTPANPTLGWAAYADVAKTLLDNTGKSGNELIGSWVGVVKNPSGAIVAEMGIVPQSIVVPGVPKISSSRKLKTRLAKRDTYAIPGTSYRLVVTQGTLRLPGNILMSLAKYALDNVLLEPAEEGYTALLTNEQFHDYLGPNAFSLVAHGGIIINHTDMLGIVLTIVTIADAYSTTRPPMAPRRRHFVRNLYGQVIDAAGDLIATWSIGGTPPQELAAASVCPAVLVAQPDGSIALGCVRT